MLQDVSLRYEDDFDNGAETIEIVFGIVFAIGLGATLLVFQDAIIDAFNGAKDSMGNSFKNLLTNK